MNAETAVISIMFFYSGYHVYVLNFVTFSNLSKTMYVSLDQMTPELTIPKNVLGWLVVQTECLRIFRTTKRMEIELRNCRRSYDSSLSCWKYTSYLLKSKWRQNVGSYDVRRQSFVVCLRMLSFFITVKTRRNGSFYRRNVFFIPDWYINAFLTFVDLGSMAYWTIWIVFNDRLILSILNFSWHF